MKRHIHKNTICSFCRTQSWAGSGFMLFLYIFLSCCATGHSCASQWDKAALLEPKLSLLNFREEAWRDRFWAPCPQKDLRKTWERPWDLQIETYWNFHLIRWKMLKTYLFGLLAYSYFGWSSWGKATPVCWLELMGLHLARSQGEKRCHDFVRNTVQFLQIKQKEPFHHQRHQRFYLLKECNL